jgi:hypothetical protein
VLWIIDIGVQILYYKSLIYKPSVILSYGINSNYPMIPKMTYHRFTDQSNIFVITVTGCSMGSGMMFVELRGTRILTEGDSRFYTPNVPV